MCFHLPAAIVESQCCINTALRGNRYRYRGVRLVANYYILSSRELPGKIAQGPKSRYTIGKKRVAVVEHLFVWMQQLILFSFCLDVCVARRHDTKLVRKTTQGVRRWRGES